VFTRLLQFLKEDIWRIPLKQTSAIQAFFIKVLRVILTAVRRFSENRCPLRASALTFYSLLSIVPVLAAAFGIAKGFGLDETLHQELLSRFAEQQEVLAQAIEFAHTLLEQTKGELIAGIGVFLLLWSVIKLLGNIEDSLNDIWQVSQPRTMIRKFSDYLAIMIVCPLLFTSTSSLTLLLSRPEIELARGFMVILTPYVLSWILFTVIYMVMPNTRVKLSSALLGGILAGTAFQLVQWGWISFQIGVAKYGAIYGSFAALPLFLIWLQMSWMIVLVGAEICYAAQHVAAVEFSQDISMISPAFRRMIALLVTHKCVDSLNAGQHPLNTDQISVALEIPISLTDKVVNDLVQAEILVEVSAPDHNGPTYQPAKDIGHLTITDVIDALQHHGTRKIPVRQSTPFKALSKKLNTFDKTLRQMPENCLLKDLVKQ